MSNAISCNFLPVIYPIRSQKFMNFHDLIFTCARADAPFSCFSLCSPDSSKMSMGTYQILRKYIFSDSFLENPIQVQHRK